MPITAEQRAARRDGLGSSDMPAILGCDPFKSAATVWAEKVFDVVEPEKPSKAISRGNQFERSILLAAAEDLGVDVELDDPAVLSLVSEEDPLFRCNLDSRVMQTVDGVRVPLPRALEAKWTSMGDEYGEAGTDQVPERVIVQSHHQMFVGQLLVVQPVVLLARYNRPDVETFVVDRNQRLIALILRHGRAWWQRHVVERVPPEGEPPSLDVIKRIRRTPEAIAEIPRELVDEWEELRRERLRLEKEEERAKAALLTALGDAEAGDFGDPMKLLTYYEQSRAGVNTSRLKVEYPDVYAAVVETSTFRVARLQKR